MKFTLSCSIFFVLPFGALMNEGTELKFSEAVTSNGYPLEVHKVETQDGYILTVFRIPHGKTSNSTNQYPVLLNHGMFGSAENYILIGPRKSLAYALADHGYDVWLMNSRGTWHSKEHRTLKPSQKEFWQFSWHEIGVYDIPAVIDHILNTTKQTSLYYVGHSQGCTSLFVMGSERPEYNDKIKAMFALAPGAIYRTIKNPISRMGIMFKDELENILDSLQIYELPPPFLKAADIRNVLKMLCVDSRELKNTCTNLFMMFTETDASTIDVNSIPKFLPLVIASISAKQLLHYTQIIASGNFQQYDFGSKKNLVRYGSEKPPLYNLKNITFPTALFSGTKDTIVTDEDLKVLAKELPNVIAYNMVPFNHMDFLIAKNIDKFLNRPILKIMRRYRDSEVEQ